METINLDAQIAIVAGVPTATSLVGRGITSITRTAAGKYTIQLDDNWNNCFAFDGSIPIAQVGGFLTAVVLNEVDLVTTKTIKFSVFQAGVLADLTGTLNLFIRLQNSSTQG